jgi:hypothetical protein
MPDVSSSPFGISKTACPRVAAVALDSAAIGVSKAGDGNIPDKAEPVLCLPGIHFCCREHQFI